MYKRQGGAFTKASILALSVSPYINASIIMQLLTIAIPSLEQLSKEGEEGRKKIQSITRYVSIGIACVLALGVYSTIANLGATSGVAVSYTHLDVYKRQYNSCTRR